MNLTELQKYTKKYRNFDSVDYIFQKCRKINTFFADNKLDSIVVGISGGVDSAVVLALFVAAQKMEGSPIQHIQPLLLPINSKGTASQMKKQ
jgi:NH3-dependent NAD+ synthetase